jgi:hypothetical protein
VSNATIHRADRGQDAARHPRIVTLIPSLSEGDTLAMIDDAEVKAKTAADTARKAAITTSLLTVLSLLIGAFIASAAAAFGGRLRDD